MNAVPPGPGALREDASSGLSYRLREPAAAAPRALLVLLHGVGGNEANLTALADGLDARVLVAFVRGPIALGPGRYAWFPVRFTPSGPSIDAQAADDSRRRLIRLVASLQASHAVPPAGTIVAGFSQGGILSASVGLSAPERVAAFGVLSGRILPELEPQLADRERLASLSAYVAHGREDETLPLDWAAKADRWLDALGVAHELHVHPGGHAIGAPMATDFRRWLVGRFGL